MTLKKAKKLEWLGKGPGFIVAIDGPSGAGKSTVSRQLADALGGRLLDTGAMYRGIAYCALKENAIEEDDVSRIARRVRFEADFETETLLVNGEDLGLKLRTPKVSEMASAVSRYKKVRQVLTRKQRTVARTWSKRIPVIVEGRDIGTVVFPNVQFKFFVTADPQVRAERRLAQLRKQGAKGVNLRTVLRQNEDRDYQDSTREIAPLRCPEDAVVVDTSSMAIAQVVKFMRDHIRGQVTLHSYKKAK